VNAASSGRPDGPSARTPEQRIAAVTGASGFIGRYVCRALSERGWQVRGAVRALARASTLPQGTEPVCWDLEAEHAPVSLVEGAGIVVHVAGRAHRMGAKTAEDVLAYRRVNVDATRSLLRLAREQSVPRVIFVSSAKVLGEGDASPYGIDAVRAPHDDYARSKAEAEELIQREAGSVGWTIVRPVFVYGATGRGNFARLMRLARLASRVPLPLGGIKNRRSVVYVENLADLLAFCAESEATAGRILPGVDTQSISTPALLRATAAAMGLTARLYPFPSAMLSLAARVAGRSADWRRLAGDFEVDATLLREIGWQPPISFAESIRRSAAGMAAGDAA
jgi:nucleoside-diphosphate-sugar epimerase